MTYGVGVDIAKVRAAIGSNDESLLAYEVAELVLPQESKIEGDSCTMKSALADLVAGKLERSSSAPHLYIYALEALCNHIGRRLDGDGHIKFLDDLEWLITYEPLAKFFKLSDPGTFPDARIIVLEQVQKQFVVYESDTEHDDVAITDAREEYIWWLKQCNDHQLDLVTFCY